MTRQEILDMVLFGADLRDADLRDADLYGADLRDVAAHVKKEAVAQLRADKEERIQERNRERSQKRSS